MENETPTEAQDAPTIVEQEVGEVADLVTTYAFEITAWLNANILNFNAIWQIAAIAGTFVLGLLVRRRFKRLLDRIGAEAGFGPVVGRILRTVSAVALPVCWAIGIWVAKAVFEQFGLPIPLMRLVGSLLSAYIVIRIVSIFIPSAYWSSVFAWVAWCVAALNAVGVLDPVITWMQDTGFSVGEANINLWTVVKGVMLTAVLVWAAVAVAEAVNRRLDANRNMPTALKLLIAKILRIALIVIACVIGLTAVGVDPTAFAVFSGAIGLGIGLGLQQSVSNLFAGFSLLAERSIQPGDVIEVETPTGPTYGVVGKMTTRYVSVRSRDNTETLVPNQVLIENPVTNWSFGDRTTRRKVQFGVAYDTDVELALKLGKEAAAATPRVLTNPPVNCLLKGFGDSSIDLEIRFWIGDPENGVANVSSAVMLSLWKLLKEHDIEIPFPQRDLHIRSGLPAPTGSD